MVPIEFLRPSAGDPAREKDLRLRSLQGQTDNRIDAGTTDSQEHGLSGNAGPHCDRQVRRWSALVPAGAAAQAYWRGFAPLDTGKLDGEGRNAGPATD